MSWSLVVLVHTFLDYFKLDSLQIMLFLVYEIATRWLFIVAVTVVKGQDINHFRWFSGIY